MEGMVEVVAGWERTRSCRRWLSRWRRCSGCSRRVLGGGVKIGGGDVREGGRGGVLSTGVGVRCKVEDEVKEVKEEEKE